VGADVESTSLTASAGKGIDRFIDALTDVVRRDYAAILALAAYLVIWTLYGIIAKGNQDLHPDMTELSAWSRDLALGYPKHPPFAADVVRGWFAFFPIRDWSYYLLAILTSTTALWVNVRCRVAAKSVMKASFRRLVQSHQLRTLRQLTGKRVAIGRRCASACLLASVGNRRRCWRLLPILCESSGPLRVLEDARVPFGSRRLARNNTDTRTRRYLQGRARPLACRTVGRWRCSKTKAGTPNCRR
jgi:hypothetical protein